MFVRPLGLFWNTSSVPFKLNRKTTHCKRKTVDEVTYSLVIYCHYPASDEEPYIHLGPGYRSMVRAIEGELLKGSSDQNNVTPHTQEMTT